MSIGSVNNTRPLGQTQQTLPNALLEQGDRGPAVRQMQSALVEAGYLPEGSADGVFGAQTEKALKKLQKDNHITADGIYGPRTQQVMQGTPAQAPAPAPDAASAGVAQAPRANLRAGATGSSVRELQQGLQQLGYLTQKSVDGQFGARTQDSLQQFQAQWNLRPDGVYGPNTRDAMDRALNGARPPNPNARANVGGAGEADAAAAARNLPAGTNGERALASAQTQVGVREATGNNDGTPSQRYMNGRQEPWCANFVSWNFRQAGHPLPGNQRSLASVQYMEDQMKANNAWFRRGTQEPKPGDIIFFANRGASDAGNGRHVGMVERVENGKVYTVEGNSSDAVRRRSYDLNNARISGYGRW
ncbi:MAG: peptidoglycan-binding protein [Deltaproteobacteria bacterium]|nr:peptidoglycan-binding protein [Deltaproteobacteria bacterium]